MYNELLTKLQEAGGCGAEKGSWADGWDQAIDFAYRLVEESRDKEEKNMMYDTLPDVVTTEVAAAFMGVSVTTVTRRLRDYKRLMVATRPFTMSKQNFIKVLEKEVPTDV